MKTFRVYTSLFPARWQDVKAESFSIEHGATLVFRKDLGTTLVIAFSPGEWKTVEEVR